MTTSGDGAAGAADRRTSPPARWRDLLLHDPDLLGVVDLDAGHPVHLPDGARGADRLALVVRRRVGDPRPLERLGAAPGDDNGEVLGVLEVLLGIEVDLPAL